MGNISVLLDFAFMEIVIPCTKSQSALTNNNYFDQLLSLLSSRNVSKVLTLEYGWFISEHPLWEIMRPSVFYQQYHEGSLGSFDAVFTYSSMEHSGLGKF